MSNTDSWIDRHSALFTDQYELTMAASYFAERMFAPATFSIFVRKYAPGRGYIVAAGLEDLLRYLEHFHFEAEDLAYLERTGLYSPDFLSYLRELRFTGDVYALSEGTLAFVDEPLIEITAPVIEAQLVETYVINRLNLHSMLATKAARCVFAAAGRSVVDFSLRRTQGTDAGMSTARASFLAGAAGTSNVLAGLRWDIPTFGTMAHSYVECFEKEQEAFRAFARIFPNSSTFLVDTYDTLEGVRAAIGVAREMRAAGALPPGIRLDSGNLDELSRGARSLLDAAGFADVRIFASGGLDEYSVDELVRAGAPIDAFGIGTSMGVSADAPYLECAYKLVEYAHRGRLKLSPGKTSWIGRKQVWRADDGSRMTGDCLALREETPGQIASDLGLPAERLEPLLHQVMQAGKVVAAPPTLAEIRDRFRAQFAALDDVHKELRKPSAYPVRISTHLAAAQREAETAIRTRIG
jgi:nicotinate phosphoribosyltransferase